MKAPPASVLRGCAVAVLILWIGPVSLAQDSSTQPAASSVIHVSDKDAIVANAGKDVAVEGTVARAEWSATGAVMNVQFKDAEQSRFTAVMFARIRQKMDDAFAGDVAKSLTGAKVRIKGKLGEYRGRPQIIINDGSQITILEAAPSTQPAQ